MKGKHYQPQAISNSLVQCQSSSLTPQLQLPYVFSWQKQPNFSSFSWFLGAGHRILEGEVKETQVESGEGWSRVERSCFPVGLGEMTPEGQIDRRGGEVALYVNIYIDCEKLPLRNSHNQVENSWINIRDQTNNRQLVAEIYCRPPDQDTS